MQTGQDSNIPRSEMLRGRFRKAPAAIRPPWAIEEARFMEACTRCGGCSEICPENIISADETGYPKVNFDNGECTFCGICLRACDDNALVFDATKPAWPIKAVISAECLSIQGVTCRTCMENCEPRAITFRLATGGRALPEINTNNCTGCGACFAPCPVKAISMQGAL